MDSSILRTLAIPALLSAVSLSATLIFFNRWEQSAAVGGDTGAEIGYLKTGENQIERRTKKRIMWQQIGPGTPVYMGDAIRTAESAEGDVQLVQGDTTLTLEPNSLIVLEESKGRLELNLVSGSLLVENKGTASGNSKAPGPVIKAGKTTVEIGGKGTQLSLSKGAGTDASIAVVKGQVDVKAGGKEFKVDEGKTGTLGAGGVSVQQNLKITGPAPNAVVHLSDSGQRVPFTFEPQPSGTVVHLETGGSRTDLRPNGISTPGPTGALAITGKPGTIFWRLVVRDAGGNVLTSSVPMRLDLMFLAPPELYSPAAGETIIPKPEAKTLSFSWSKPQKAKSVLMQVATDSSFSKVIADRKGEELSEHAIPLPKDGTYYWRVVAIVEGSAKPLSSEVRKFQVRNRVDLKAPALAGPVNGSKIDIPQAKNGVTLEWAKVEGANQYDVVVQLKGKTVARETVEISQVKLPDPKPGVYSWRVRASASEDNASPWSGSWQFEVMKTQNIRWLTSSSGPSYYTTEKPTAEIQWQSLKSVERWRLRYASSAAGLDAANWQNTGSTKARTSHSREGTWYYEVQGLGQDGTVLAVSQPLRLQVMPRPDLPPPDFAGSGPARSDKSGNLTLKWQPVEGAAGYLLTLRDSEGKAIKSQKPSGTSTSLTALMPGKYEAVIATLNAQGKPGKKTRTRTVIVPVVSDIPPPVVEFKVH